MTLKKEICMYRKEMSLIFIRPFSYIARNRINGSFWIFSVLRLNTNYLEEQLKTKMNQPNTLLFHLLSSIMQYIN